MISFTVPGQPQGKARARSRIVKARDGRQFTSHYTPKKTREYEYQIGWLAKKSMKSDGETISDKPFNLIIICSFEVPKSWPKWKTAMALAGQIVPTTKPDLDNVTKAVKDGCNGVIWLDDCQVIDTQVSKKYGEFAGVHVSAYSVNLHAAQIKHRPEASEKLFA